MQAYKRRTGERMTYEILAEHAGIAVGTLQNMGSRPYYNTTLTTLARICDALDVTPGNLLELIREPPKAKRGRKKESRE